jgi:hypothetical protein
MLSGALTKDQAAMQSFKEETRNLNSFNAQISQLKGDLKNTSLMNFNQQEAIPNGPNQNLQD